MRASIWVTVLVCVFAAPARSQQGTPSAIPVGIVIAERKPISKTLDFVGRVEAINRVEVRARIKGYLEAVLFKEGNLVKEGDPLYRIEKQPELATIHPQAKVLSLKTATTGSPIPFHPGAIRYYRDQQAWTN